MPFRIFLIVFVSVFTLVFGLCVVTTLLLPKSYMGVAYVQVKYKSSTNENFTLAQTESDVINSEVILRKVVRDLNLDDDWGRKYLDGEAKKTWDTAKVLKSRVLIRPVIGSSLISIRVVDTNPNDAATIANSIANVYTSYAAINRGDLRAIIVDSAYPNKTPFRPKHLQNCIIGFVMGILLGSLAGAVIALIVFLKRRKAWQVLAVNPPQINTPNPSS